MTRITPEEVLAAYKATGLKPRTGGVSIWNNACCPLGALYRSRVGVPPSCSDVYQWAEREYPGRYSAYFHCGFDDCRLNTPPFDGPAYRDGQDAYRAVLKEFGEVG